MILYPFYRLKIKETELMRSREGIFMSKNYYSESMASFCEQADEWERKQSRAKRQCAGLGAIAFFLLAALAFRSLWLGQNEIAGQSKEAAYAAGQSSAMIGQDTATAEQDTEGNSTIGASGVLSLTGESGSGQAAAGDSGSLREYVVDGVNLLVLVNKDYAIPEEYELKLHVLDNGSTSVADVMYADLSAMLTAGTDEGLEFVVASGYRDADYQAELLEEDIRADVLQYGLTWEEAYEKETQETMPAGHSEHETGLAVDIVSLSYQLLDARQENTAENEWLQENCCEYGFILRYPKEKEDITGIAYEPWHFRYVGREAAREMKEQGITLEEYVSE